MWLPIDATRFKRQPGETRLAWKNKAFSAAESFRSWSTIFAMATAFCHWRPERLTFGQ